VRLLLRSHYERATSITMPDCEDCASTCPLRLPVAHVAVVGAALQACEKIALRSPLGLPDGRDAGLKAPKGLRYERPSINSSPVHQVTTERIVSSTA
jgi:hypothetical protein